jgi:hypothetical protein
MNYLELDSRETARYVSLARFGIGVALLLFPRRVARQWFGEGEDEWQGKTVAMRAIGARDVALAVGAMTALENGGDASAWLRAAATADAGDTAAVLLAFRKLRGLRRWLWPVISGFFTYVDLTLAGDLEE